MLYIHLYIHRIGFPFICHKHITEKPRHIAISFETAAPRSICHRVHIDTRFLRFFVAGRRNLQHYLFFQCSHEPHIMRGIFAAWSYRPSVTMGQCSLCLLSVNHQRGRIWYWQLLIECHVRFLKSWATACFVTCTQILYALCAQLHKTLILLHEMQPANKKAASPKGLTA